MTERLLECESSPIRADAKSLTDKNTPLEVDEDLSRLTAHRPFGGGIEAAMLVIVLALGSVILFGQLGYSSFWIDEAHIFRYCIGTFDDIVEKSRVGLVNTSPLPLLIARMTVELSDASEFWLRFPSAVFGMLTVLTLYFVGRRLGGPPAGFVTAMLTLGSWGFVYYSRIFRHYSMAMFCTAALLWLALKLADRWSTKRAVLYSVTGIIGVLLAYEVSITVMTTIVFLLVVKPRVVSWSRHVVRLASITAPILTAFGASYIAFMPSSERQAEIARVFWSDTVWLGGTPSEFLNWTLKVWWLFLETGTGAYFKPLPIYVSASALLLGIWALLHSPRRAYLIPCVGIALIMFVAASLGHYPFAGERTTLTAAVALMPMVGYGLIWLWNQRSGALWRIACVMAVVGFCTPTLAFTIDRTYGKSYVRDHLRPLVDHIRAEKTPDDLVYVYWQAAANMEYLNRGGDIPFVTGIPFYKHEPQKMVRSVLDQWATKTGRLWLVIARDHRRDTDRLMALFDKVATRTLRMRQTGATLLSYVRLPETTEYFHAGRFFLMPNEVCTIQPRHTELATTTSRGNWSGIDLDLPNGIAPDSRDVMTFEYTVESDDAAAVGVHALFLDNQRTLRGWQALAPGDGTTVKATVVLSELNGPERSPKSPNLAAVSMVHLRLKSPAADSPAVLRLVRMAWSHTSSAAEAKGNSP